MNFTTESVSPMDDERIAAMKSAGWCALSHAVCSETIEEATECDLLKP